MVHDKNGARMAVDIGGTFTDVVLEAAGCLHTIKTLTTQNAPEQGVAAGVGELLARADVNAGDVGLFIHGTTLATNAIIERTGSTTALITTEGFRDVLEIGYESRYDQYDVMIDKAPPLVPRTRRLTVAERIDVSGRLLEPLDETAVRDLVPELKRLQVESVAVGFLHAYVEPSHERRVREILAEELPGLSVSLSCEVCPEVREYERFTTTAVNAYIRPLMQGYLSRLRDTLSAIGISCPALLMTSAGGLTTFETAMQFPVRLVESGPAGGAIFAAQIAAELALDKVISFDMGGTTAKICMIEGFAPRNAREFEVDRAARFIKGSGMPLRIPVIEMLEIGAGGGSIARVDTLGNVRVGPESAGAEPGPASYARGGQRPTVTDADIVLGRIDVEGFAGGNVALDPSRAEAAIVDQIGEPLDITTDIAAYSVCEMVDETMANAARVHAVECGMVAADQSLIAFGGAAPLHVGRIAEKLGIRTIVVPTNAGVGSTVGFLAAPIAYDVVRSRHMRLSQFDATVVNAIFDDMEAEARAVVEAAAPDARCAVQRGAYMRYFGQGHEVFVPLPDRLFTTEDQATLKSAYNAEYEAMFRRVIEDAEVEVLTWVVTLAAEQPETAAVQPPVPQPSPTATSFKTIFDTARSDDVTVSVFVRSELELGANLAGPALIVEEQTSTFVPDRFTARVSTAGHIVIEANMAAAQ